MKSTEVSLGERIAQIRDLKGWSQERLADESGIPRRTVQNIEYGAVSPRVDTLLAIASALDTSLDALTGRQSFAKSQVAEKLATQSRVQEHWIEAARLLSAIAQASPLRRLIALYILSNDERYIQELRTLAGSAPIVQFLKKIP